MLKYSFTIQKPASFTWEKPTLPAPAAKVINSGLAPVTATIGTAIPAAVIPATVADPSANRKYRTYNPNK